MSPEHIQLGSSSPEDEAQALEKFRSVISNVKETRLHERADLQYVNPTLLGSDEMGAHVRLLELLEKDTEGTLTMEEVQEYSRDISTLLAVGAEYSRKKKNELEAGYAEDPLITRHAFSQYLINELNAPYMRAQDREGQC